MDARGGMLEQDEFRALFAFAMPYAVQDVARFFGDDVHPGDVILHNDVFGGNLQLSDAGIVLLNQAVLLAGINDSVDAQAALCERLVDLRVVPYYLHQLDRVAGAAHFEVPIETGRQIVRQLRDRLPGYAVPRYVAEVPGAGSKSIIE